MQIRMKPSVFYGKRVNAQPHVRALPEESEDSCLSDSAGSDDEDYVPKPGDEESCSESDRSSSDEENVVKPGESGFKISTITSQTLFNFYVG